MFETVNFRRTDSKKKKERKKQRNKNIETQSLNKSSKISRT